MADNVDNASNGTSFVRQSADTGSMRRPKTPKTPMSASSNKKKFDIDGSFSILSPFRYWLEIWNFGLNEPLVVMFQGLSGCRVKARALFGKFKVSSQA